MTAAVDVRTDVGLRRTLRELGDVGSWDTPAGPNQLAEIRRRAVRNAAHIARAADARNDRGFVDDVVTQTWLIVRQDAKAVLRASRPWAYLMRSAQRHTLTERRAQQLLTCASLVRGGSRFVLPHCVSPVGASAAELAKAFRHEPSEPPSLRVRRTRVVAPTQPTDLLVTGPEEATASPRSPGWLTEFIDHLIANGASRPVTAAAVEPMADLFLMSRPSYWEHTARRDPILTLLGLGPDQRSALVALLAGSRSTRRTGRTDSLLGAIRAAVDNGRDVLLTPAQQRRVAIFTAKAGEATVAGARAA